MAACSRAGTRTYAYGQSHDPSACNVRAADGGAPRAVANFAKCVGGYAGIYDMVGNVTEWESACDGLNADGTGTCADRGGSFVSEYDQCLSASVDLFSATSSDWGIRCCATPK